MYVLCNSYDDGLSSNELEKILKLNSDEKPIHYNILSHNSPDAVCDLIKSQRRDDLIVVSK